MVIVGNFMKKTLLVMAFSSMACTSCFFPADKVVRVYGRGHPGDCELFLEREGYSSPSSRKVGEIIDTRFIVLNLDKRASLSLVCDGILVHREDYKNLKKIASIEFNVEK